MERHHRTTVVNLFWSEFAEGEVRLRGAPVQHARVRRVERGDAVRLLNGRGHVAHASVASVARDVVTVTVERIVDVAKPLPLEVIVPVADRDRMLLAAEKCAELQVTGWRPAYFARSRSVAPRGEGEKFREKVRVRMQCALEQSGSAWMPEIHEEVEAVDAWASVPREWKRFLLDGAGVPLLTLASNGPTAIAVGPEGGLKQDEIMAARESGWVIAALDTTTLRFETAVIAGAAVIRAVQLSHRSA